MAMGDLPFTAHAARSRPKTKKRLIGLTGRLLLLMALLVVGLELWFVGIPIPMPTHLTGSFFSESIFSGAAPRASFGGQIGFDLREALVDITTKNLYDSIAFEDEDGGAWKQGWDVQYQGNEWDKEKLKVFVVPHSHNDPGWLLTVEEYYQQRTRHIFSTIVQSLSKPTSVLIGAIHERKLMLEGKSSFGAEDTKEILVIAWKLKLEAWEKALRLH